MKLIKIIALSLVTIGAWLSYHYQRFACAWGSNYPNSVVDCGIIKNALFFLAIALTVVSIILIVVLRRNQSLAKHKNLVIGYVFVVVLTSVCYAVTTLSDYHKMVYIIGMSEDSCEDGNPPLIFSFKISPEEYHRQCERLYRDCSKEVDTDSDRWNEFYCWTMSRGYDFNSYESCERLTQDDSIERCKYVVAKKKDEPEYCLSDTFLSSSGDALDAVDLCLMQFSDYSSETQKAGGFIEDVVDTCKSFEGLQADNCFINHAKIYLWPELCSEISSEVEGLRSYCAKSIEK